MLETEGPAGKTVPKMKLLTFPCKDSEEEELREVYRYQGES
jgi:hypothetical protein